MTEEEPLDEAGFRRLAERSERVARAMVDDRVAAREAWMAAGRAVEFTLKALIMRRLRLNGWPDASFRPDLHTHNLRSLMRIAGLDPTSAPKELRGALRTALDWERIQEYDAKAMPRREARSMVQAVFDNPGVIAWINDL